MCCFLFCVLITFQEPGEGFSFQFESPIITNLKLLPVDFKKGYSATYLVETEEERYHHTVTVSNLEDRDGVTFVTLVFTSINKQTSVLTATLSFENLDILQAKSVKVTLPFGEFKLNSLTGPDEQLEANGEEETLNLLGKDVSLQRISFVDEKGQKGQFWMSKGLGPLGIGVLKRQKKGQLVTYTLIKIENGV